MASQATNGPTGPVPSMVTTDVVIVSVVFSVLSLLSVILRFKARRNGKLQFQADDWIISITWFLSLGVSIDLWVFAAYNGLNYFKVDPLLGDMRSALALWCFGFLSTAALAAVKVSILLFYKRIFAVRRFKIFVFVSIALVVIWALIMMFLNIFEKDPVSANWTGEGVSKVDILAFAVSTPATSIALDLLVLLSPIPMIARLHMDTKRKIAVAMIFWLGSFCVVAAVVRFVFLYKTVTAVNTSASYSAIALESTTNIFTILEPNCSIIAANLPCYGPLLTNGRSAESLINSVRSKLSLSSLRNRSSSSRSGSHSRTQNSGTDVLSSAAPKSKQTSQETDRSLVAMDDIELMNVKDEWSRKQSQGQNKVNVEHIEGGDSDERARNVIEETRTYDVRIEDRV